MKLLDGVEYHGTFTWELSAIAVALKITEDDARQYFTDGRRVSFILERRIAKEILKGTLAKSEGAGWDVMDANGGKWEVRSITKGGIYFCPSYMVGSGRKFDEPGFRRKADEIEGYIVSDVESFPEIPYWIIPVSMVLSWWDEGLLGAGTKVSRVKALSLVKRYYE